MIRRTAAIHCPKMICTPFTPCALIYPARCAIIRVTKMRKGQIMAKQKGKNRNYQTPARAAEQRAAPPPCFYQRNGKALPGRLQDERSCTL